VHSVSLRRAGETFPSCVGASSGITLLQKHSRLQVDLDRPDHTAFPELASLPYADCVLEPGQMLYVPPRWWHYVKALAISFSVSFWWQ